MTCTPTPAEAQIQVPEGAAARSTHATGTDSPSTPMAQTPRKGAPASYLVNLRSSSRADRLAGHKAVRLSGGQVVAAWAVPAWCRGERRTPGRADRVGGVDRHGWVLRGHGGTWLFLPLRRRNGDG